MYSKYPVCICVLAADPFNTAWSSILQHKVTRHKESLACTCPLSIEVFGSLRLSLDDEEERCCFWLQTSFELRLDLYHEDPREQATVHVLPI
jgi:hypothetical protein